MRKLLILLIMSFMVIQLNAQKTLSTTESMHVNEAKANMQQALTLVELSDLERVTLLKRSAATFKNYGQAAQWPEGDIPLQIFMDEQFEQCKNEITDMADWVLQLEQQNLNQKLKIINSMQIEVLENQIQLLIPGKAGIDLSKDVVNSVFGVDFIQGTTGGKKQDAKELVDKMKELAQQKKLEKYLNILIDHHRESLRKIDAERKELRKKVPTWKKSFFDAYNGAFTFEGYENALLSGSTPVVKTNILVGTWRFGYEKIGYFYWTFSPNGEFVFDDKMNEGNDLKKGTYSVNGNTLRLIGPDSECSKDEGKYIFVIEEGELRFTNITDPCLSRHFTLNHIWKK